MCIAEGCQRTLIWIGDCISSSYISLLNVFGPSDYNVDANFFQFFSATPGDNVAFFVDHNEGRQATDVVFVSESDRLSSSSIRPFRSVP